MKYNVNLGIKFFYEVEAKDKEQAIDKARKAFNWELRGKDYSIEAMVEGIEDGYDLEVVSVDKI